MATSSSTKRAAKLAQRGKGRRIRFQGGTVFPAAVALTLVLGMALIAYSRGSLPAADDTPPTVDDHWHAAYGFYLCDDWYQLSGNLEELNSTGTFANTRFRRTGIHSHDDGVIHWHPYTSAAVGDNARLEVFLENYGVEVSDDGIKFDNLSIVTPNPGFPPANGFDPLDEYIEGETQCNGEDAEVSVKAWGSFTDTDAGNRYIANVDQVRVANDGMVFAIYFTADGADQVMPPWAQQLPDLGAVDSNQLRPEDVTATTLPGASTPGSSVAGSTAPAESTAPGSTAPDVAATTVADVPATTSG